MTAVPPPGAGQEEEVSEEEAVVAGLDPGAQFWEKVCSLVPTLSGLTVGTTLEADQEVAEVGLVVAAGRKEVLAGASDIDLWDWEAEMAAVAARGSRRPNRGRGSCPHRHCRGTMDEGGKEEA